MGTQNGPGGVPGNGSTRTSARSGLASDEYAERGPIEAVSAHGVDSPRAALERLADVLGPRRYATTLTSREGYSPHLTVTSRHTQYSDDVFADGTSFWWGRAERIAAVDEPKAAADKIAAMLLAVPEPTHG